MKIRINTAKAGFAGKSLIWALLLYGCITSLCHWQEISRVLGNRGNDTVVSATSDGGGVASVKIRLDSMQKSIHVAEGLWQYLRTRIIQ